MTYYYKIVVREYNLRMLTDNELKNVGVECNNFRYETDAYKKALDIVPKLAAISYMSSFDYHVGVKWYKYWGD